jgi:hypothetical protein
MAEDNGLGMEGLARLYGELVSAIEDNSKLCEGILTYDADTKLVDEYGGDTYGVDLGIYGMDDSQEENTDNVVQFTQPKDYVQSHGR